MSSSESKWEERNVKKKYILETFLSPNSYLKKEHQE